MNFRIKILRVFWLSVLMAFLFMLIGPDLAEARGGFGGSRGGFSRGGGFGKSFGGSRKSFSSPKSYTTPKSGQAKSNFGSNPASAPRMSPAQKSMSSIGGSRLGSGQAYTQKYGTPRQAVPQTITRNGVTQNYMMYGYGGYGSGLMTGYMMGRSSWFWMTPFHPAFYYSRPYYVENADGTVGVYPPTFSWSKVFYTLLILGVIGYIIYVIVRNKRRGGVSQSSFS